ncbi:transcriptional regulator [Collibacillus ludicampi]|uniref:Transcriptional regulator n=1 Tax=Collibacillus ludicampi TaxID=2771369 RepID=A0AAV4LEH3_9BACL|nr:helix-turn-helix domain-containing protein [Collibacillus ludicampi]GIM46186.1 transcriptional regulator [Collibacillus ludicampi]
MYDEHDHSKCPIEKTMNVIGGKWTFLILRDLFFGPRRFGELQRSLKGISPRTLSIRLKELEEEGIVSRTIFSEIPPHVEYSLTEKGKTLRPIFDAMIE